MSDGGRKRLVGSSISSESTRGEAIKLVQNVCVVIAVNERRGLPTWVMWEIREAGLNLFLTRNRER